MSGIYLPYQKIPRWNIDRAIVAYNCAQMGLPGPGEGLELAMSMWERVGNKVYDYSGNNHAGNWVETGPVWVPEGLKFTLDQGAIECGTDWLTDKAYTIVGKFRNTTPTDYSWWASFESGASSTSPALGVGWYNTSPIRAYIYWNGSNKLFNAIYTLPDNYEASYALVIVENGPIELYFDGKLYWSDTVGAFPAFKYFTIGGHYRSPVVAMYNEQQGSLEYTYLFSKRLFVSQIQTIHNNSHGMFEPMPLAPWSIPPVGVAPTSIFYGPLVGPLGGPI